MILGFDEAGRGAVLGPLVIGCVAVPDEAVIPESVADSKQLTDLQRERVYSSLVDSDEVYVAWKLVSATEIDSSESISSVTITEMAELGNRYGKHNSTWVADACLPDSERVTELLRDLRDTEGGSVVAEHSADEQYPVVSAASVVAKQVREREISELPDEVGSGYPSDPTTRDFLKTVIRNSASLPAFVRESWSTIDKLQSEVK